MTSELKSLSPAIASKYSDEDHLRKVAGNHVRTLAKKVTPSAGVCKVLSSPDITSLMNRVEVFEEFSLDAPPEETVETDRKRAKTVPLSSSDQNSSTILEFIKARSQSE